MQWSDFCRQNCLNATPVRKEKLVFQLPAEYHNLTEAFSKTKASQLPPHRTSDCALNLTSSQGKGFSLYHNLKLRL